MIQSLNGKPHEVAPSIALRISANTALAWESSGPDPIPGQVSMFDGLTLDEQS